MTSSIDSSALTMDLVDALDRAVSLAAAGDAKARQFLETDGVASLPALVAIAREALAAREAIGPLAPNAPGWWWWRDGDRWIPREVYREGEALVTYAEDDWVDIGEIAGEWRGQCPRPRR